MSATLRVNYKSRNPIFIINTLLERQNLRASYIYEQSNDVLENWLKLVISYGGGGRGSVVAEGRLYLTRRGKWRVCPRD